MALNDMQKVYLKIRQIFIDFPDGVTLGIGKLEPVAKGWVVKMKDGQNLEGESGMMKAVSIAAETTGFVAGWKSGTVELWDVVEIHQDEDKATKSGVENGQMTIYQIETGRLKWLI